MDIGSARNILRTLKEAGLSREEMDLAKSDIRAVGLKDFDVNEYLLQKDLLLDKNTPMPPGILFEPVGGEVEPLDLSIASRVIRGTDYFRKKDDYTAHLNFGPDGNVQKFLGDAAPVLSLGLTGMFVFCPSLLNLTHTAPHVSVSGASNDENSYASQIGDLANNVLSALAGFNVANAAEMAKPGDPSYRPWQGPLDRPFAEIMAKGYLPIDATRSFGIRTSGGLDSPYEIAREFIDYLRLIKHIPVRSSDAVERVSEAFAFFDNGNNSKGDSFNFYMFGSGNDYAVVPCSTQLANRFNLFEELAKADKPVFRPYMAKLDTSRTTHPSPVPAKPRIATLPATSTAPARYKSGMFRGQIGAGYAMFEAQNGDPELARVLTQAHGPFVDADMFLRFGKLHFGVGLNGDVFISTNGSYSTAEQQIGDANIGLANGDFVLGTGRDIQNSALPFELDAGVGLRHSSSATTYAGLRDVYRGLQVPVFVEGGPVLRLGDFSAGASGHAHQNIIDREIATTDLGGEHTDRYLSHGFGGRLNLVYSPSGLIVGVHPEIGVVNRTLEPTNQTQVRVRYGGRAELGYGPVVLTGFYDAGQNKMLLEGTDQTMGAGLKLRW